MKESLRKYIELKSAHKAVISSTSCSSCTSCSGDSCDDGSGGE